jgi:hypothetical protein
MNAMCLWRERGSDGRKFFFFFSLKLHRLQSSYVLQWIVQLNLRFKAVMQDTSGLSVYQTDHIVYVRLYV